MPDKEISFDNLKKLLILLCRYPFEEANKEALSLLINDVSNWNRMVELINAHGIIALAAYNIREAGLEKLLPEDAMAALDNGHMQSMVRNTWLTERWKEVNTILTDAGIKHVLLKGMALEHTLYGAKGLRQMTDNDILVKREDSIKAWHLLLKQGFKHELIKSSLHEKIPDDLGKHLPCLYKNGYAIEIHHKLYGDYLTDKNKLYDPVDNADEILVEDTKAWILSKETQIKHLLDHFKKHALGGDQQLRLYADIVLLDKTVKIEIPDDFILDPQQNTKPGFLKAEYKAAVNSVPLKYRLRYIIGDVFPSVEWMKKRYKCSTLKAVFYYPLRVGKLLWLL